VQELLKYVTEEKIKERTVVSGRRGRRRKLLLNLRKGEYWKLKEEAPDDTTQRTQFGRGYGPVVRQITEYTTQAGEILERNKWCKHIPEPPKTSQNSQVTVFWKQ
jgi:hypothetical protein